MSTNSRWRCAGQAPRIGRVLTGDEFSKNKTASQHRAYLFHHFTFFTTLHFSLLYSKHYFNLKAYFEPPFETPKLYNLAARTVLVVAASTHRPGAAKVTLACFW